MRDNRSFVFNDLEDHPMLLNNLFKYVKIARKRWGDKIFKICDKCNGVGIEKEDYVRHEQGCAWNGKFCEKCKGIGALDFFESFVFKCPKCKGRGIDTYDSCELCNGTGVIDWVKNITNTISKGKELNDRDI